MCEVCLKRFHKSEILIEKIPSPGDIVRGDVPEIVAEAYQELKTSWTRYVAHLGEAAHDHDQEVPPARSAEAAHPVRQARRRSGPGRLGPDDKLEIRRLYEVERVGQRELAATFHVSRPRISQILNEQVVPQ